LRRWLYRFALERGYFESFLSDYIGKPFVRLFRWFDRLEREVIDSLAAGTNTDGPAESTGIPSKQA
jgi:hypothetical protein